MRFDPAGPYRRFPLAPHQLVHRYTRVEDMIVLCHLGVPRIEREHWSLVIDGLVEQTLTLRFDDLRRYPKVRIASVHQCCGDPRDPLAPTQRVCNVEWGGVRLGDVLEDCLPTATARFVWSYGADFGELAGVVADAYVKDLPLSRVPADVLLAYEIDGEPLPPEHGFPVRLVVPGFYGTNSVKWLVRMTLAEGRATGPFTTHWYNDPLPDGGTAPVWSIAPQSVIVSPAPGETIERSVARDVCGWAWADGGVAHVDVRTEDGWHAAELERPRNREWQRFSLHWTPQRTGPVKLTSRADTQPTSGWRNAQYRVPVYVS